jgi:hypothetical protein
MSPWNYVDEDPYRLVSKFPEETMINMRDMIRSVSNFVLVPDPELQTYVPGSIIIPRAINFVVPSLRKQNTKKVLVIHAPSRRIVKGTDHVLEAVKNLQQDLEFDFQLIENLNNTEARKLYEEADIVIDQLRIGWYGVLAVETMALGKADITYIREDLVHHLGYIYIYLPLAIANPKTIQTVLRDLIQNENLRKELGERAYTYAMRVHDVKVVSQQLLNLYLQCHPENQPLNVNGVMNFIIESKKKTIKN